MALTGWSPFMPGDADNSSLPVAALEYRFINPTAEPVEAVYSFHAKNFLPSNTNFWDTETVETFIQTTSVQAAAGGFVLAQSGARQKPWQQSAFSATVDDSGVKVNYAWFRGGWFDPITMVWKSIRDGAVPENAPITAGEPGPGASLYVPFRLEPGEEKVVRLRLAWYVPETNLCLGQGSNEGGL
jgi:uncharacterized protein (DUF608 family)